MATIEHSIEVDVPVRVAYNQWTQFEEFPRFMEGIESVQQIDDTHLHWVAEIAGHREEWDAEITEQHPDHRVASQLGYDACFLSGLGKLPIPGEARVSRLMTRKPYSVSGVGVTNVSRAVLLPACGDITNTARVTYGRGRKTKISSSRR